MSSSNEYNILYKSLKTRRTRLIKLNGDQLNGHSIKQYIAQEEQLAETSFNVYRNGKIMNTDHLESSCQDIFLHVHLLCLGGKGGFGSMLRAIGAQIEKTTNKEACRDLSGRRLRDINSEKRIKEWIDKQAKRKAEQEQKRLEKLEKLKRVPKIEFKDDEYFKTKEEIPENVEDALEYGLKQAKKNDEQPGTSGHSCGKKRKEPEESSSKTAKKMKGPSWLGLEGLDDEDDDEESDDEQLKKVSNTSEKT